MAEGNESVGKITLDLEVKSDLEGQINKVSEAIGKSLKDSMSNATKGIFDGLNESIADNMKAINATVKSALDEMKANAESTVKSISGISSNIKTPKQPTPNATEPSKTEPSEPKAPSVITPNTTGLKTGIDTLSLKIKSAVSSALSVLKSIKVPTVKFPKSSDSKTSSNSNASQPTTRPPPKFDTSQIKAQMENLQSTLDNTNSKIDSQKDKLARLKEEYEQAFNITKKNKLAEEILRTEGRIQSLISKSDRLGFKLADLDAKMAELAATEARTSEASNELDEGIKRTGNAATSTSNKIKKLSEMTKLFTSGANASMGIVKGLGNRFKELGSKIGGAEKATGRYHYTLGLLMKQFFTWMIVFPLLMKGIQSLASGLLADLKVNEQFNQSLEQIKTNLMVAFTPIYQAILPAINSLMSALATLTTYIASFTSAIFGKTYQQSYQATQGLINAKEAMGAYGESAKKAAKDVGGLVGIDEINNLSKTNADSGADNSKVPKLTQPSLDTNDVDTKMQALADKIKKIFGEIFAPMKAAWDAEGKATMDAFKYALDEIWQLIKDIGKSFLDVWTNGTGLKICTDILKLLQTIFNIIGDIAKAFDIAWNKGGLGTAVVQAMFNALDSVLNLLRTIGEVFRTVWNSGVGVEICTNILEILKNIFTIIGQVADSFNKAFQSPIGYQLMTDILNLLNGILRNIKDITSSFSKAWESNGDTVCSAILLILDDIIGTISDITNKWSNAWESNGAGDTLMNSLLSTLGKILTTIGDIGQGMRESIGKVADIIFPALIQFATNVSDGLGNIADGFKIIWDNGGQHLFDGIVRLIGEVGKLILQITGGAFKDFGTLFRDTLAPAIGKVADVLGDVVRWLADLVGKINENKPLIEGIKTAFEGWAVAVAGVKILELGGKLLQIATIIKNIGIIPILGEILTGIVAAIGGWPVLIGAAVIAIGIAIYTHWDEIKAKSIEIWDSIGEWLSNKWEYIKNSASNIWNGLKDFLAQWGVDILAFFVGGPVALINVELAKHWDVISAKAIEVWNSISTYLSEKWENLKTWATEKFTAIKETISTKWEETKTGTSEKWESIKSYLGTKWDEIKTDASTKFDGIKTYIGTKWDEINSNAPGAWSKIQSTLSTAWNSISTDSQNIWNGIVNFLNTTFNTSWGSAWNGLTDIVKNAFYGLESVVKKPINAIIGMANKLIDGLDSISIDIPDSEIFGDMAGESFGISIPHIPALATGGIVDSPTLAMIGETGHKEGVLPLEENTGWMDLIADKVASRMGTGTAQVTTTQESGNVIFIVDGSVIGQVAISEIRKARKQGIDLVIPAV